MMATRYIQGLEGIKQNLDRLEGKQAKKLVRHALREAAKPIQAEARQQAKAFDRPETPDAIWKNIATRAMKARAVKRKGADLGVKIGVKHSNRGEPLHYAVFLEHGTSEMAAQPFLRVAADTQQTEAINRFADDLKQGIHNTIDP